MGQYPGSVHVNVRCQEETERGLSTTTCIERRSKESVLAEGTPAPVEIDYTPFMRMRGTVYSLPQCCRARDACQGMDTLGPCAIPQVEARRAAKRAIRYTLLLSMRTAYNVHQR